MKEKNMCSENIYLIGFMGCGKSSVASYLHGKYGMTVLEMDEEIEAEEKMCIAEIFSRKGETYFREKETELLKKIGQKKNLVVSCGGGVPMRAENVKLIKQNGKLFLLTAEPETILSRVKNNHSRPLLEGKKNLNAIRQMMEDRKPAYEAAADFQIRTDDRELGSICREILGKLGRERLE